MYRTDVRIDVRKECIEERFAEDVKNFYFLNYSFDEFFQ